VGLWLISDVDCEFDCWRLGYESNLTQGDPGLTKGVPHLLDFFKRYSIRATFHIQEQSDPNFSVLVRYPEVYSMIKDYNQEISLHVHVAEEDYETRRFEIGAGFRRQQEQGYEVSSFRAGWYFTNVNTVRVLEELGIKYDCSPAKNSAVGPMSWYGIPDSPYYPSYKDITKVGEAKVLMIPISNRRLGITISRDDEYESELMKKGIQTLASVAQEMEAPIIIYFTTHSWKPLEMNTPSFRNWEIRRREEFFDFVLRFDVKSLTVSEAGKLWGEGGFKPYYLRLPDLLAEYFPWYRIKHYLWLSRLAVPMRCWLKYRLRGEV